MEYLVLLIVEIFLSLYVEDVKEGWHGLQLFNHANIWKPKQPLKVTKASKASRCQVIGDMLKRCKYLL